MSEHTHKMIELVGASHTSIEDAAKNAVAKAAIDQKSLRWFEVLETRGHIEDGKIAHWQVRVEIGATSESDTGRWERTQNGPSPRYGDDGCDKVMINLEAVDCDDNEDSPRGPPSPVSLSDGCDDCEEGPVDSCRLGGVWSCHGDEDSSLCDSADSKPEDDVWEHAYREDALKLSKGSATWRLNSLP